MIDEKELIEEIENLPFIHGRYDKKNANPHFISGVESMHEMIMNLINSQPKADSWISCSEKLPPDSDEELLYFAQCKYHHYNCKEDFIGVEVVSYLNGAWYNGFGNVEVISWMPIPE